MAADLARRKRRRLKRGQKVLHDLSQLRYEAGSDEAARLSNHAAGVIDVK